MFEISFGSGGFYRKNARMHAAYLKAFTSSAENGHGLDAHTLLVGGNSQVALDVGNVASLDARHGLAIARNPGFNRA